MHIIKLEDVMPAMEVKIVLASSFDAGTRRSKDLKFCPASLSYHVRFHDGEFQISDAYKNPGDAISRYNEHDA